MILRLLAKVMLILRTYLFIGLPGIAPIQVQVEIIDVPRGGGVVSTVTDVAY